MLPDDSSGLRIGCDSAVVAKALHKLIAISNKTLDSVEYAGGADCAFLASFSVWLLDLPVQVDTATGHKVFSSCEELSRCRARIVLCNDSRSLRLVRKQAIIPNGNVFMRANLDLNGVNIGDVLSYGKVPWDSLLKNTFGRPARVLLDGGLTVSFEKALGCAARIFTAFLARDPSVPTEFYRRLRRRWQYISGPSHGRGFVNAARQILPELAGSERLMDAMEQSVCLSYLDAREL